MPAAVNDAGHIKDAAPGTAEVSFASSTVANAWSAIPNYSGGSCYTVYCHGSNMPKETVTGANMTPSWADTTYINGTASHDCAQCHGYPPSPATIQAHVGKLPTDCKGCHDDANAAGTGFDTVALHVDGVLQVSGCNGCHGQSGPTGAPLVAGDLLSNPSYSPTGHGVGMHPKHVTDLTYTCSTCHDNHNMPTLDSKITISFRPATLPAGGTYTGLTLNSPYGYLPASITTTGPQGCSNLYCHGTTMAPNGGTDTTPEWATASTGACGTCHGKDAANPPTKGSHVTHAGTYAYSCSLCHNASGVHVNNQSEVLFNTADSKVSSASYTGTPTMLDTYGNCSATYCHGAGTVQWGGSLADATQCDSCHGGNKTATATAGLGLISSGKHTAHVANTDVNLATYACGRCHAGTVTTGNDRSITGANHVNTTKDVSYDSLNSAGTAGTCNNLYCHSDGKGGYNNQILATAWTSGAAMNCKGCHGDNGTSQFGEPDYANGGAGVASANSHSAHVNVVSDCGKCHANTSTNGTSITGASHINNAMNVDLAAAYDTNGGTSNWNGAVGQKNCTATYCHGAGTAQWGGSLADVAQCDSCHGGNKTATATAGLGLISSGKHTAHVANTDVNLATYACGRCHAGTVTTGNDRSITGANHVNTTKDVSYDSLNSAGTAGTCNNLYCHSDGKGGYNNQILATAWTSGAAMNCKGCHGDNGTSQFGEPDYANGGAGVASANSHSAHVNVVSDCGKCHANTSTNGTSITGASHINNAMNVDLAAAYDTNGGTSNWNGAVGQKNCTATYCHGAGTAQWGGSLADVAQCDSCHGGNKTATATAGLGLISSGKHTAHVANTDVNLATYECGRCHATTVTTGNDRSITGANHVNTTKDVSYDSLNSAGTAGTCNNLYCHSDGKGGYNNQILATAWTSGAAMNCKGCHGDNGTSQFGEPDYANGGAGVASANSHSAHVNVVSDCGKCHANTSTTGTSITGASHINNAMNVDLAAAYDTNGGTSNWNGAVGQKNCTATYCHGAGTAQWGGSLADVAQCDSCHGGNKTATATAGLGLISSGKHTAHVANTDVNLATFECGRCHAGTVTTGNDRSITGANHVNTTKDVSYDSLNSAGTAGTCNNLYCHSDGKGGYNNQILATAWTSGAAMNCKGCHGDNGTSQFGEPDYANGGAGVASANSHSAHVNVVSDCGKCHANTSTNGTSITGASHINNAMNVDLAAAYDTNGGTSNWNGAVGQKNCTATYCHGAGTAQWGGSLADVAQCDSCHGGNKTATATAGLGLISSGKHTAHVANTDVNLATYECGRCHATTVTTGNDRSITGANHVNTTKDVSYDSLNSAGTAGTCNNLYCHSDGKGGYNNQVLATAWTSGAAMNCKGCHGDNGTSQFGEPDYANAGAGLASANSHTQHVTAAADCGKCHANTSTNGTSITGASHINSSINFDLGGAYDTNGASSNWSGYSVGQKTCSATTCHGAGTPQWGANTTNTATCVKCHGVSGTNNSGQYTANHAAPGFVSTVPAGTGRTTSLATAATDTKVGAHNAHITAAGGYASAYACTICHQDVVSTATTSHMNGSTTFLWSAPANTGGLTPVYNSGTNSCSATYCHGNYINLVNQGTGTAPVWRNTAYIVNPGSSVNATDCGVCHQFPPTRNHLNTANHPAAILSPANCNSCHNHNGYGDARHINGILEAAGGACDGCHSYDTVAGAWGSVDHKDAPINQGWGAHAKHIDHLKLRNSVASLSPTADGYGSAKFNLVCGVCHNQNEATYHTMDNSSARRIDFNGSTTYQFGPNPPVYNGASGVSSAAHPKTCSNVSCHFKATPVWSAY